MLVDRLLLLTIELRRRVISRRVFQGLTGQIDGNQRFWPVHRVDPPRRHEHLVTNPPIAGVDDQVANRPGAILDEQVLDMADITVGRMYMIADHDRATPQVDVVGWL